MISSRSEPDLPNAHVERWWPQAEVMPQAVAMVGHGGFGTTMMPTADMAALSDVAGSVPILEALARS